MQHNWERASNPESRRSVTLIFSEDRSEFFAKFDRDDDPAFWPNESFTHRTSAVIAYLNTPMPKNEDKWLPFLAMEILRRILVSQPLPIGIETGIDRYFREHPNAA
jgi:hypothetical protein